MSNDTSAAPKKRLISRDPNVRRIYPLTRLVVTYEDGSTETILPTPEEVAVAIAKCSRTDTPFDQNVLDVTLESAADFHLKWVVGFGHGSVAEHAVASVALERISQVVIKIIEDARLASFTEKSSRYQVFTRERVILPAALRAGPLGANVGEFLDRLYTLYDTILELVRPLMIARFPKPDDMSDKGYAAVTKARVCDVARHCLPAAAAGNMGVTCGAREWALIITKLASSPYEEAHEVAQDLLWHLRAAEDESPDEALKTRLFPSLLKYAGRSEYMAELPSRMRALCEELLEGLNEEAVSPRATFDKPVVMLQDDEYAEARITAALLAKESRMPFAIIFKRLKDEPETVARIIREAVAGRSEHDQLPREFEHAAFKHEIVMDYGAWRDVQRHRMCTQLNQALGTNLGYVCPDEVREIGLADNYNRIMEEASALYNEIVRAGRADEAVYIVPMAFRRRLIVGWDARELDHFITLRSGKKGHPSYRRIAQETWHTLRETHPLLANIIRVDLSGSEEGQSTLGAKPKGI